ncbi:MAG: nucleotide pyrophosphatase/phosphodiesterase family protein [Thermodesulfobacteriota bacterium]
MNKRRVVVLDVVGLQLEHLERPDLTPNIRRLVQQGTMAAMRPPFPAVTLPVQATLTTGTLPAEHGVLANGFFTPEEYRVSFWEQAASLVQRPRLWQRLRQERPGTRTAALFLQNTLFADCDVIVTPKPLHSDDGMIQWCYSKPVGYYEELCETLGEFNLMHYWGPLAGIASSRWIAGAAVETMKRQRPELMLVYLPHLDYNMQRLGPSHPEIGRDVALIDAEVGRIVQAVEEMGLGGETTFVVLSEYRFYDVAGDVPLNRILRRHGLLAVRTIAGREYLDIEMSPAFAMVDHQLAHVYVREGYRERVEQVLAATAGIDRVLDRAGRKALGIDHPRAGDLVAVADKDRWFSYYWWEDRAREPPFARHVDIHGKPGYDPLELFFDPASRSVPQETSLIKGSHGYPPSASEGLVPLVLSAPVPLAQRVVGAEEVAALLAGLLSG